MWSINWTAFWLVHIIHSYNMASRKCSRVLRVDEAKNVENECHNEKEDSKILNKHFKWSIWKSHKANEFCKMTQRRNVHVFFLKQFVIRRNESWRNEHWTWTRTYEHWLEVKNEKKLKRLLNCITWNQGEQKPTKMGYVVIEISSSWISTRYTNIVFVVAVHFVEQCYI